MRERGSSQLSPRSVMMTSSGPRLGLNRGYTTTESAAKKDAFGLPIDKLSEQVRFEKSRTQIEKKSRFLGDDLNANLQKQRSKEGHPSSFKGSSCPSAEV